MKAARNETYLQKTGTVPIAKVIAEVEAAIVMAMASLEEEEQELPGNV